MQTACRLTEIIPGTARLVDFHCQIFFSKLELIENKKKITPIALNIGVKHAMGDIIIIFSSHGFAERRFLTNNVKVHTTKNVDCVGGTISTIGETFQSKAISLAQSSIFGVGNSLFRYAKKDTPDRDRRNRHGQDDRGKFVEARWPYGTRRTRVHT